MTTILILLALGIAFILIEVIVPGGILGIIGTVLLICGCALSFADYGFTVGLAVSGAALLAAALMLWLEFRILPKTKIGRRAFLTKSVTGVSAAFGSDAQALVGKAATAITTLAPSGYITIDGNRYEAFCQTGFTEAGTTLTVIGADNFRLIVSPSATKPIEP